MIGRLMFVARLVYKGKRALVTLPRAVILATAAMIAVMMTDKPETTTVISARRHRLQRPAPPLPKLAGSQRWSNPHRDD